MEKFTIRNKWIVSIAFSANITSLYAASRGTGNPSAGQRPSTTTYFVKGKHWFNEDPQTP